MKENDIVFKLGKHQEIDFSINKIVLIKINTSRYVFGIIAFPKEVAPTNCCLQTQKQKY